MIRVAEVNWEQIDGTHAEDLLALPFDRFCNRVLAWLQARMTETAWRSFESRLTLPPPGVEATSGPWSDEEMSKSFAAFEGEFT